MQLDLEELLGRKVDVVTRRALSRYIEPYVSKDLKLIYARTAA
jgi:predicted nucleotidyltransferase